MDNNIKTKGGIPARIGKKFHLELERIKLERIKNGKSDNKLSTEKLTNVIVRHKEGWKQIVQDLIDLPEEDLKKLWN